MNKYFKQSKALGHTEYIEMTENTWLSITKQVNKSGDGLFTIFKVPHSDDGYEGAWWKNPNRKINKEEFDLLKAEFLNWIDQTFKK